MKPQHPLIFTLASILLAFSLSAEEFPINTTSKFGDATYKLQIANDIYDQSKWSPMSGDEIPITPHKAVELSKAEIEQIFPNANSKFFSLSLSATNGKAFYFVTFRIDEWVFQTVVLMDGSVATGEKQ